MGKLIERYGSMALTGLNIEGLTEVARRVTRAYLKEFVQIANPNLPFVVFNSIAPARTPEVPKETVHCLVAVFNEMEGKPTYVIIPPDEIIFHATQTEDNTASEKFERIKQEENNPSDFEIAQRLFESTVIELTATPLLSFNGIQENSDLRTALDMIRQSAKQIWRSLAPPADNLH